MSETQNINEVNEAKNLIENVSEATNSPKFGVFEQVLCSHLYQAGNTPDPLRKIQLTTDAALMLDPKKAEALKIDIEKVKEISIVNNTLQTATTIQHSNYKLIEINFPFNETVENYHKYLAKWFTIHPTYYPKHIGGDIGRVYEIIYCGKCRKEVKNEIDGVFNIREVEDKGYGGSSHYYYCKFCDNQLEYDRDTNSYTYFTKPGFKRNEDTPKEIYWFRLCEALAPEGYVTVQNCFTAYALPFALELVRKLSEAVRPEIYLEVAKMFSANLEVKQKNAL